MRNSRREVKVLAIDRLVLFIRAINTTHKEFERKIGVSNSYISNHLRRRGSISSKILNIILLAYPELNVTWLLTGHSLIIPRQKLNDQHSNASRVSS